jgi:hypothetical protein
LLGRLSGGRAPMPVRYRGRPVSAGRRSGARRHEESELMRTVV